MRRGCNRAIDADARRAAQCDIKESWQSSKSRFRSCRESVAEATLLQWKKKPGEAVAIDEILIEIETDKVVLEVPAPSAGVLAEIVIGDGGTVVGRAGHRQDRHRGQGRCRGAGGRARCNCRAAPPPLRPPPAAARAGVAMPAAAKLMADNGVAAGLGGRHRQGRPRHQGRRAGCARGRRQGRTGRRRRAGCRAATAAVAKPLPAVAAPIGQNLGDRPEQRVPMSRLRARVAERLLQSQATNAILTTFNEVNMAPVMEMRKKFQEKFEKEHGVKLGFMSFFVKAAVAALKKYPVLNASVDGNDIVYHGYFDIGIAVGSPRGLVVPILRNADQMSFADIEKKIAEFGSKAKDGKLSIEELIGRHLLDQQRRRVRLDAVARRSSTRRRARSSACTPPRTARWSRTARSWCGRSTTSR